jgi:hypothetical protein
MHQFRPAAASLVANAPVASDRNGTRGSLREETHECAGMGEITRVALFLL